MSKKIYRNIIHRMRTNEVSDFIKRVTDILGTPSGDLAAVSNQFSDAAQSYAALMAVPKVQLSSLAELDAIADEAWRVLNAQIQASLDHPYEAIREAARQVDAVFSQTPNPTQLNYAQEYGALHNLIERMYTIDLAVREKAWIEPHFEALKAAVDAFSAVRYENLETRAKQEVGALKVATTDLAKAWSALVKYLEFQADFAPTPELTEIVDQLACLTKDIRQQQVTRNTRNASDSSSNR